MAFFTMLLIYAATFILSELFKPKPELENARPAGLGDFNFPTATEGRAVPLLWGTVEITAPNVIWYGDLRTDSIREKVKTGMFSSKKRVTGYQYNVGLQFGLCRGPMNPQYDGLMQIRVDDDIIYGGVTGSPLTAVDSGTINIQKLDLFGADAGGIGGNFSVFPGTATQARSTYLEGVITGSPDILPAYRGTCYVVGEQIYIGNAPSLRPFKFTMRRIPDGLGLSGVTNTELINGLDANPMNVLFEILTNTDWGLAISSGDVDTLELSQNAQVLFDEGNGFSALLDNPRKTEAIIQEIERQTDGVLLRDTETGRYTFSLIRDTDIPSPEASVPQVGPSNADSVDFSRASWSETTNEVRVSYPDPNKNYKESFALAQDMANEIIQASNVSVTENYMGVKNAALANSLAWRDLRALATPLAKASIVTNREMYQLKPGNLISLTWPQLGISGLLMRVSRLDFGELVNNKITIDAVEDIFTSQAASFSDPIDTGWTELTQTVSALSEIDQLIFETPRIMNLQDPDNPLQTPRITTVARLSGGGGDEYVTLTREGSTKAAMGLESYVTNVGTTPNFVLVGELRDALLDTSVASVTPNGAHDIQVDPLSGGSLAELIDASARPASDINNLLTLVYITAAGTPGSPDIGRDSGEFIMYTQAIQSIGGSPAVTGLQLSDCWRGALDSVRQGWPAGSRVWFVGFGGAGLSSETFTDQYFVDAKLLPSTQESGTLAAASANSTNAVQIDAGLRVNLPLVPDELRINTALWLKDAGFTVVSTDIDFAVRMQNWRTIGGLNAIQGLNTDGTTFDPAGADAGDGLSYIWELYDEGSPSIGSPNLIARGQTPPDAVSTGAFGVDVNDIYGAVADPNGGVLRLEVRAHHQTTSPGLESRDTLIHSFSWTGSNATSFGGPFDPATYLGRIPYGAVVSPGVVVVPQGSPGSPYVTPALNLRFAQGARMSDGPGTGENGKVYMLADDGSPAQLIFNAQTASPASQSLFTGIAGPGSPQNWVGHTVNLLHYHHTGRPIFFQIEDSANNRIVAWGIMEPQTSTIPDSVNNT